MTDNQMAVFKGKQIRRHWDEEKEKWFFSVIDIVEVLTGSSIPKRYWSDLKRKLSEEGSEVYEKIVQLNRTIIIYQMVLIIESFWSVVSFVISGCSRCFAVATTILSWSSGRFLRSSIASRTG